jgi:hypothetical protein
MAYGNQNNISFTGAPKASSRNNHTRGRFGDSLIAFVTSDQQQMLEAQGGAGTINPETGLPEFYTPSGIAGEDATNAHHMPWGFYEDVDDEATYVDIESAPVPDFDDIPAPQPSLTPTGAAHEYATIEEVDDKPTTEASTQATETDLLALDDLDKHHDEFQKWIDSDDSEQFQQEGDVQKVVNDIIKLALFVQNPWGSAAVGVGHALSEELGVGAGVGLKPTLEFRTDWDGNNVLNAGVNLDGGVGVGVTGTPVGIGKGKTFASVNTTIGANGVDIAFSGLSGSSTSGDANSNTGTTIDQSTGISNAHEFANTDDETEFGNSQTNEGSFAHINPAELGLLHKNGYAPPVLHTNFGNFDDIAYVNPNAPLQKL